MKFLIMLRIINKLPQKNKFKKKLSCVFIMKKEILC